MSAIRLPPVSQPTDAQKVLLPQAMGLLTDEAPCALFYDMDAYRAVLTSIKEAFPPSTLHAVAMKANPLAACLNIAKEMGMGIEVASPGEFEHARRLGFEPSKIVMDSPAKTKRDIKNALTLGTNLNADNFEELARIDAILAADFEGGGAKGVGTCTSTIGIRVNPQFGEGAIAATGTIAPTSKFGVPLMEIKEQLLDAYKQYAWMTAVHCHVGSQGCPIELLIQGSGAVLALAKEINAHVGADQVRTLDIGGGMPVDYGSDVSDAASAVDRVTPIRYTTALKKAHPELFDETKYKLVTEYGRFISAKCGLMVSNVEYTKSAGGRRIAIVHCGADLYIRTAYQPANWPHRVSCWTGDGVFLDPNDGETATWDVVGPLCFRGDIVAKEVELPTRLASGCGVVVHDSGAYTLAMFSKYNSRQAPPVYGYSDGGTKVVKLSNQESFDEALSMWQNC